jgi:hypothetical protein
MQQAGPGKGRQGPWHQTCRARAGQAGMGLRKGRTGQGQANQVWPGQDRTRAGQDQGQGQDRAIRHGQGFGLLENKTSHLGAILAHRIVSTTLCSTLVLSTRTCRLLAQSQPLCSTLVLSMSKTRSSSSRTPTACRSLTVTTRCHTRIRSRLQPPNHTHCLKSIAQWMTINDRLRSTK